MKRNFSPGALVKVTATATSGPNRTTPRLTLIKAVSPVDLGLKNKVVLVTGGSKGIGLACGIVCV
jgi:hypothetical protein